jgi:hypothetical protein
MDSSTPSHQHPTADHPAWGPPRVAPIVEGDGAASPAPRGTTRVPRRRHPAAKARRIAGWTTVATSAAIVGYLVTANAQVPASQSVTTVAQQQPVVATPTAPVVAGPNNDDAPAVSQPTVPVARPAVPAAQPSRQLPAARPITSTHGS